MSAGERAVMPPEMELMWLEAQPIETVKAYTPRGVWVWLADPDGLRRDIARIQELRKRVSVRGDFA